MIILLFTGISKFYELLDYRSNTKIGDDVVRNDT